MERKRKSGQNTICLKVERRKSFKIKEVETVILITIHDYSMTSCFNSSHLPTSVKCAILIQNTNSTLHKIQRQTCHPYTEYKHTILTQNTKTNSPLHRIQRQMCHPYTEYKDKQPLTQNTKTNMPSLHRIQGQTALYTEYKDK